jgi:hypothetical protein
MKFITAILILFFIFVVVINGKEKGVIAIKVNNHEAQVHMEKGHVYKGEKVALFSRYCVPKTDCFENKIGEGEVTEILNSSYFMIKVNPGITLEENTVVTTIK